MSAYFPPVKNLPIFDADQFTHNDTSVSELTIEELGNYFLKYPIWKERVSMCQIHLKARQQKK